MVFSSNALNTLQNEVKHLGGASDTQQFVFGSHGSIIDKDGTMFGDPSVFAAGDPFKEMLDIGIDDRGNSNDVDYQDFTLRVISARRLEKDPTAVPEPSVLGALLGVSLLAASRRRHKMV